MMPAERTAVLAGEEPQPSPAQVPPLAASAIAPPEAIHLPPASDLWDVIARSLLRLLPERTHVRWLWALVVVSAFLRLLWLGSPQGGLIFDEAYYVNASRVLIGIPGQEQYQQAALGLDPNTEHPPLAKLIVAASMAILGDNPYGWRIPSVIAGTASVLLLYGIVRMLHPNAYAAVLAAALFAFDNLVFVHSRIFTLDIFQVVFMLLGAYWYLKGRSTLAGMGIALAALCKIGGVLGIAIVVGYEALCLARGSLPWQQTRRDAARRLSRVILTFAFVFLGLLAIMDYFWVGYSQPFQHLQHIVTYGTALRRDVPSGIESAPWQWLWNDRQIPYLEVDQQVRAGDQIIENRPAILFLGALNPYTLAVLPFGLSFAALGWWRRRPGVPLATLALSWFALSYLPFYVSTLIGHRIAYIFYFLPSMPAVAMAGTFFLIEASLPRLAIYVYLTAVAAGFWGMFPFKPVA